MKLELKLKTHCWFNLSGVDVGVGTTVLLITYHSFLNMLAVADILGF